MDLLSTYMLCGVLFYVTTDVVWNPHSPGWRRAMPFIRLFLYVFWPIAIVLIVLSREDD